MGFISKEEWIEKGRNPDEWRSEEEWTKRGEEILPIVNANFKKLEQKHEELKSDLEKVIQFNEKQAKRLKEEGYKQALKEIEERKKAAVEEGNYSEVQKADADKDKITQEFNKPETPKTDAEFEQFKKENDWYDSDPELRWWANTAGFGLADALIRSGKPRSEAFKKVAEEVKKRFPEKFTNPNREKAPSVEGDAGTKGKTNGKGFADLPDSAKKQYKRIKDQMALKGREYKKEDYLENYEW